PDTDIANEIVALRAELDALKTKQEEAEATALLSQGEEPATATDTQSEMLRVYGFMDFGLDKFFFGSTNDGFALIRPTPATTFVFGNLNLYFDAKPVEHLRTLLEVRLTAAPHGEETSLGPPLGTSYDRIDTTAFDFSSPSAQSQLRLGGLFIERAWSEYTFDDLLKVQWGLFLNPFGIWNLDHGSPTLIALMLPTFISSQMVPTRLLGVNAYGSKFFGSNEVGYAVHISNGRSPLDFALTENKGLGARLYAAHEGDFGRLVVGMSGYFGSYVDVAKTIVGAPNNTFDWAKTIDYSEQVVGVDAALDVGDLRVRAEGVLRWIGYHDGKSEQIFTGDGSQQFLTNRLEWATYILAAYRTPWRIEPYLEAELSSKSYTLPRFAGSSRASSANVAAMNLSAGFNVELTTHTLFKTQVVWDQAYDRHFKNRSTSMPILFIRVVDSF
ncbi:MAG: hypothetical protein RL701_3441, partial [Pseudomonadota bacterium]